ncbi:uncharacterized protein LOC129289128 [Prosopis cineraria]|uniref:uncharacterized protein LOC129289128 n=1 Tax=Prosopis cineraria TaxID=364024 RepID=UPI00240F29EB|nr:uncharacterized protein LOC129289128 [Prosopis cineraria]
MKGDTPLHVAARAKKIEAMKVILSKCKEIIQSGLIELNDIGKCITSQNNYGNTAFHEAVLCKHLEGVNVLLSDEHTTSDQKACYSTWNSHHGCKLNHQAYAGDVEGFRIMLTKSKMIAFQRNSKGNLPVHFSSKMGHVQVVEKFLELDWFDAGLWLNNKGRNILHMAEMNGQAKMVNYLLGNPRSAPKL